MNNDIKIPILIMAFIRPDLLKQCLTQLSKFKPPIIYVMGDGPRNENEIALCNESRNLALNPEWDCEVIPIFNDKNEGIVKSFIKGMNLMFSEHEYGIYLEDDILLSESFYSFAKELLIKWELKVLIILATILRNGDLLHGEECGKLTMCACPNGKIATNEKF